MLVHFSPGLIGCIPKEIVDQFRLQTGRVWTLVWTLMIEKSMWYLQRLQEDSKDFECLDEAWGTSHRLPDVFAGLDCEVDSRAPTRQPTACSLHFWTLQACCRSPICSGHLFGEESCPPIQSPSLIFSIPKMMGGLSRGRDLRCFLLVLHVSYWASAISASFASYLRLFYRWGFSNLLYF